MSIFVPLMQHQSGQRFATDTYVKQAVSTWKSDVYHLLPMCHVYIEVRIKVSAPECLLLCTYVFFLIFLQVKFLVSYAIWNAELLKVFVCFLKHTSVCWISSELYILKAYYCYHYYHCILYLRRSDAFCGFCDSEDSNTTYEALVLSCCLQMASKRPAVRQHSHCLHTSC